MIEPIKETNVRELLATSSALEAVSASIAPLRTLSEGWLFQFEATTTKALRIRLTAIIEACDIAMRSVTSLEIENALGFEYLRNVAAKVVAISIMANAALTDWSDDDAALTGLVQEILPAIEILASELWDTYGLVPVADASASA